MLRFMLYLFTEVTKVSELLPLSGWPQIGLGLLLTLGETEEKSC